jgi:sterol desaturase/sphingolipid hydroxylase (fatty acid hydroxylase superfamily)
VNGLLIKVGLLLNIVTVIVVSRWLVPSSDGRYGRSALLVQIVEIIVVADLRLYFVHRMFHSIPPFWRFHQIHYSIEELDLPAPYRAIQWIRATWQAASNA